MPSTIGLPPRLQRRTCSRNRFSSFSTTALSSRVLPSRSSEVAHSLFSETVLSMILLRSPIAASFVYPSPFRSLFLFFLSPSSNFSLLCLLYAPAGIPFVRVYIYILSRYPFTRVLLSSTLNFVFFSFLFSRWFLYDLSRLYFCTHSFSPIDTFSPYCRSRGRRVWCFFRARFISLSERSPSAREAVQHRRKAKLPPLEFRTVSIWEPPSILSRRHVEIFQIPRSRYLTDFCCLERGCYRVERINVIVNKNSTS